MSCQIVATGEKLLIPAQSDASKGYDINSGATTEQRRGNSNGNIRNDGFAAKEGNCIYYRGKEGFGLYKFCEDTKKKIKIADGNPRFINVLDGLIILPRKSSSSKLSIWYCCFQHINYTCKSDMKINYLILNFPTMAAILSAISAVF